MSNVVKVYTETLSRTAALSVLIYERCEQLRLRLYVTEPGTVIILEDEVSACTMFHWNWLLKHAQVDLIWLQRKRWITFLYFFVRTH